MGKSRSKLKQRTDLPLRGLRVVTLAVNAPGPVTAARLCELGASITKIEPPSGDPLKKYCPKWYRRLIQGQEVVVMNLKDVNDRVRLDRLLSRADLLLTSSRPLALKRLYLDWTELHGKFPSLCHIALIGHPAPRNNVAGHDLTYQARVGLIAPPTLPNTLLADLTSAERMVSTALSLILRRQRSGVGLYDEVIIEQVAKDLTMPLRCGLTANDGVLGGKSPQYNLYRARDGWIAVAALEPHFWKKFKEELRLSQAGVREISAASRLRAARDWERWALQRDLPIVAVRQLSSV